MHVTESAWTAHGAPLYQHLIGGSFLDEPPAERRAFTARLLDAAAALRDEEVARWLDGAWRKRLTGAWIVAVRRIEGLRAPVERRLLASESCYAGQGLCIATARFCDERAAEALLRYLEFYLPPGDRAYDQEWAVGALAWLDGRLGTERAAPLLADPARWRLTPGPGGRAGAALDPRSGVARVARVGD